MAARLAERLARRSNEFSDPELGLSFKFSNNFQYQEQNNSYLFGKGPNEIFVVLSLAEELPPLPNITITKENWGANGEYPVQLVFNPELPTIPMLVLVKHEKIYFAFQSIPEALMMGAAAYVMELYKNIKESMVLSKQIVLLRPVPAVTWKEVFSAANKFRFLLPKDWKMEEFKENLENENSGKETQKNSKKLIKLFFNSPEDSERDYSIDISVFEESLPLAVTSSEYWNLLIDQYEKSGLFIRNDKASSFLSRPGKQFEVFPSDNVEVIFPSPSPLPSFLSFLPSSRFPPFHFPFPLASFLVSSLLSFSLSFPSPSLLFCFHSPFPLPSFSSLFCFRSFPSPFPLSPFLHFFENPLGNHHV